MIKLIKLDKPLKVSMRYYASHMTECGSYARLSWGSGGYMYFFDGLWYWEDDFIKKKREKIISKL